MKMIHDADRYYEAMNKIDNRPLWMKDERLEYCDSFIEDTHKTIWKSFINLFK